MKNKHIITILFDDTIQIFLEMVTKGKTHKKRRGKKLYQCVSES